MNKPFSVVILNPLGAALEHYTIALAETLKYPDVIIKKISILEPSSSSSNSILWLLKYLGSFLSMKLDRKNWGNVLIVTWPVAGFLDCVFLAVFRPAKRVYLVIHDPIPLVRSIGYSTFSARIARWFSPKGLTLLAHSEAAFSDLKALGLGNISKLLPHPINPPRSLWPCVNRDKLSVVGQYKQSRDIDLMAQIARRTRKSMDLEIHGRGWPDVTGWKKIDGFRSEFEIDQTISSSFAVLIPYQRFYQSGIAIRALELGVPSVGPLSSSLRDFFPDENSYLVEDITDLSNWIESINKAKSTSTIDTHQIAYSNFLHTRKLWEIVVKKQVPNHQFQRSLNI